MTTAAKHSDRAVLKFLARCAILGAFAFVLMMVEFPLPFLAPPFYKMDFSEIAVLIGGFAMGPAAAAVIEALKIVLNLLFTGTSTQFVGEIANYLIGISFCIPAAIIYRNNKTKKSALTGLAAGTVIMAVMGVLLNYFVLIPAYSFFYHLPLEAIISMGAAIFPVVSGKFTFVLMCVTPFNLVKGLIVSVITALHYKRVSPLLH